MPVVPVVAVIPLPGRAHGRARHAVHGLAVSRRRGTGVAEPLSGAPSEDAP